MAERNATLETTIETLITQKKYPTLRDILVTMNPADIAVMFTDLEERTLPLLFRLLPKDIAAETFAELEPDLQELLIRGFSDSELKEVVDELYLDDAVDLVEEMPANVVKRILRQADAETRKLINDILKYPEENGFACKVLGIDAVEQFYRIHFRQRHRRKRQQSVHERYVFRFRHLQ